MVTLNVFALFFCGLVTAITMGRIPRWFTCLLCFLFALNGVIVFNNFV